MISVISLNNFYNYSKFPHNIDSFQVKHLIRNIIHLIPLQHTRLLNTRSLAKKNNSQLTKTLTFLSLPKMLCIKSSNIIFESIVMFLTSNLIQFMRGYIRSLMLSSKLIK